MQNRFGIINQCESHSEVGAATVNDDHCLHGDSICLNEFSAWNYSKL